MAVMRSLGSFGVTKEKMFTVPQLWKVVKLHVKAIVLLSYGTPSSVSSRAKILHNLILHISKMDRNHGSLVTVKWLKANHVALQKYLGGDPLESLRGLEPGLPLPRLYSGLPSIINKRDRRRIINGHTKTIQFWLSCFSIYRIVKSDFVPKLQSITGAFSGDKVALETMTDHILNSARGNYFSRLELYSRWVETLDIRPRQVSFIQSSSPSNRVSWHGLFIDAFNLHKTDVFKYFTNYCTKLNGKRFYKRFMDSVDYATWLGVDNLSRKASMINPIGQLAFKEEAAGKLRVFALVDVWTQSLLKPLHEGLFDLVRAIPNDGTFNQEESVHRSAKKSSISGCAYSFDLSSATDRLPILLQSAILDRILPWKIGDDWSSLLVEREYSIPKGASKYSIAETSLKYAVGQPMGALSSWAMLALTHHYLLQFCASKAQKTLGWYENYEILGDDLVIFDHDVAKEYLLLMKDLGLEINLSKSISSPSKAVFEFAKRTVVQGTNVSGLSVKQLISATSIGSRIANILYYANLGLIRTNTILSTLLGRFYKTDVKSVMLPSLALLGTLFKQEKISLKALMTVMVDPKDKAFDFNKSQFALPLKTIITAQKELLNDDTKKLELFQVSNLNIRLRTWAELESDIVMAVLWKAKSKAEEVEELFLKLHNSGALTTCLVKDANYLRQRQEEDTRLVCDHWLLGLVIGDIHFDSRILSSWVDDMARDHILHPKHYTLADALTISDEVDRWWQRFDLIKQKRISNVESLSPVFTWISETQRKRLSRIMRVKEFEW